MQRLSEDIENDGRDCQSLNVKVQYEASLASIQSRANSNMLVGT